MLSVTWRSDSTSETRQHPGGGALGLYSGALTQCVRRHDDPRFGHVALDAHGKSAGVALALQRTHQGPPTSRTRHSASPRHAVATDRTARRASGRHQFAAPFNDIHLYYADADALREDVRLHRDTTTSRERVDESHVGGATARRVELLAAHLHARHQSEHSLVTS